MVEAVFSFLLIVLIVLASAEVLSLIKTDLYAQRVARQGAKQASLTSSTNAGYNAAVEMSQNYLGNNGATITVQKQTDNTVICTVDCKSLLLKYLKGGSQVHAQAIYPFFNKK